jgi:release factor glutamine methyltransferase
MEYRELWLRLTPLYDEGEARAIVRWVMESAFGLTTADILSGKITQLSADDHHKLEKMMERLEKAEPLQYVLGEAVFHGRSFKVEQGVLIPRPETEELCDWVLSVCTDLAHCHVLDIGTGSGCIAITLAKEMVEAEVEAWDVSATALSVAADNARRLAAEVTIRRQDALRPPADRECFDIIVSNPPYVGESERQAMHPNVLRYEPEEALFVSEDDPLLFYRAIATYAAEALRHDGRLFFEINPRFSEQLTVMLGQLHFIQIETRDDAYGRCRFIQARRP